MCEIFKILGVLLLISSYSWGQNSEITTAQKNDMTWYVNPLYDENCSTEYSPTFAFPVFTDPAYQSFMAEWGDGAAQAEPFETETKHKNVQHLYVDSLLHRPLLDIRKADTLDYSWDIYNFSSMSGFIDTSYLVPASLMWKVLPPGTGKFTSSASDPLFGQRYRLSNPDKTLDELYFELSAQTRCGKTMRDTLVVVLAHGKLEGYKDIICFEGSYPLWDKMKSSFIDETTLTWEICYPTDPAKQGTLSAPTTGSSVTYTPYTGAGRSDSVRICLKGEFDQAPGFAVTDTIVLKINRAPEITVTADTLIAEDHEINILKISNEWFKATNIVSYKIDEVITANNGMQVNDTVYYFTRDINTSTENRYARLRILMDGLTGCPQVSQEFTFLDLCTADFEFPEPLELCAGDAVPLNLKGFDKYTVKRWTLEGDSPLGTLDGDSTHYTSPLTAGSRSIKLETSKSFKTYKGNFEIGVLPVVRSVNVVVHPEPSLVLNHVRDTLCREQNHLEILRTWVSVTPDFYRDSIRLNGDVFDADYEYRMNAVGGGEDLVVFTIGQGSCTKWGDEVRDTLFLYRLPEMITGNFSIASVCEMETPAIDVTGLGVAAEVKNVYWTGTGGIVSDGMPPQFIPTVNSRENGSLTLHVQPPKGCPEDTLRQGFDIYRMPLVNLESDTVCRIVGQPVTVYVNAESGVNVLEIRKIDWYRKGNEDILETTAGLAALNYVVNKQDSTADAIELVARVWPVSPCDSWALYDTVEIVLQDQPEIRLNDLAPSVCQGEETDLSDIISTQNTSSVTWYKKPTTAGTLNGTLYNPGEYWGTAGFVVRADGMYACPQLTMDVDLTIHHAPIPQINIAAPVHCQNDTVYFNTAATPGLTAVYVWNFGDNSLETQGSQVSHVYAGAGDFQVALTGKYGSCERRIERAVQVLQTPSVRMNVNNSFFCTEMGDFELRCVNMSPDAGDCAFEWWRENEIISLQNDSVCMVFRQTFGNVVVKLKAVHQQSGCVAEQDTVIVSAHQARPGLLVEPSVSCLGTPIQFTNTSVSADTMELDLGDGSWSNEKSFKHIYETTSEYLIRLRVKNAEGCSGELEKKIRVNPLPEVMFTWEADPTLTGLPDHLNLPNKANGGIRFNNLSRITTTDNDTLKYKWYFGDDTPSVSERSPRHLYPNNGSYTVILCATSKIGCVDSISETVSISVIKGLYLPTAFIPTMEDESVNRFQPKGIGLHEYTIRIFDKHNNCVWMSDKLENGRPAEWWNGTFKGEPLPKGLYKWEASALFIDGTRWERHESGSVLLIR